MDKEKPPGKDQEKGRDMSHLPVQSHMRGFLAEDALRGDEGLTVTFKNWLETKIPQKLRFFLYIRKLIKARLPVDL